MAYFPAGEAGLLFPAVILAYFLAGDNTMTGESMVRC